MWWESQSVTESHIFSHHMASKISAVSQNYANCCNIYFSGISNPKFRLCKPYKIQLCCHRKTFQIFKLWGRLCEHSISHHIFKFCGGYTVNEQSVGQPMWPSQNLNMWWDILCSHNLPHNLNICFIYCSSHILPQTLSLRKNMQRTINETNI